jgi:hypothetical protein
MMKKEGKNNCPYNSHVGVKKIPIRYPPNVVVKELSIKTFA